MVQWYGGLDCGILKPDLASFKHQYRRVWIIKLWKCRYTENKANLEGISFTSIFLTQASVSSSWKNLKHFGLLKLFSMFKWKC